MSDRRLEHHITALRGILLCEEADVAARIAAAHDLSAGASADAVEALAEGLRAEDTAVVSAALDGLERLGDRAVAAAPELASALLASSDGLRPHIARALARVDPTHLVPIWVLAGDTHAEDASEARPDPQNVIENVPALVGHMGLDERYTYVNRAYSEWAGLPASAIVGMSVRELFGDAVYDGIEHRLRAAFSGETVEFDNRVTFRGARPRDIRVRYIPDRASDGEVVGIYVLLLDVTDLIQTLAELRASEARLRRLIQSVPDTILRADPDGLILDFASPRHPDPTRFIGKRVSEIMPGADHEQIRRAIRQAIATDEVQSLDLDVCFDGAQRQLEARHARIDEDETFVIVRDISDVRMLQGELLQLNQQLEERVADRTAALARESLARQEANEALAARAEELERVMRDAQCIIWKSEIEQGEDDQLIWTPTRTDDPIFRAVLPLEVLPDESYLDAWSRSIVPEDKARMDAAGNRAVLSGQAGYVQTYTCLDAGGARRRIREDVTLRRTGARTWEAVGVAHDITSLAEAEAVTQRLEERFRAVFDNAPVGMLIRDRDLALTHSNKALHEMLGYTAEQLRALGSQDLIDPRDWDSEFVQLLDELYAGSRHSYAIERRYLRKSGESFWVHLRVYVVRDAAGDFQYAVSMLEDISDRKAAQAAIEDHERERTRLLQRVVDVQEEERARIAYELHDQIGQQLTSLLLGLKAAEASVDLAEMKTQTVELRAGTAQVVDAVSQMAFDMRPTALDDMGVVTALRRDVEDLSGSADFHAVFRAYEEDAIDLSPDVEVALYRVVNAALMNIVQHARARNVSVIIQPRDGGILAMVEDDGLGFDTKAVMGGPVEARFGLLAMQERVRNVGGELSFESTVGAGSAVYITLPTPRTTP